MSRRHFRGRGFDAIRWIRYPGNSEADRGALPRPVLTNGSRNLTVSFSVVTYEPGSRVSFVAHHTTRRHKNGQFARSYSINLVLIPSEVTGYLKDIFSL